MPAARLDYAYRRDHLTTREAIALQYVANGLTYARVAQELHCSEWSVKRAIEKARFKLNAPTAAAAVAEGFRKGLLS